MMTKVHCEVGDDPSYTTQGLNRSLFKVVRGVVVHEPRNVWRFQLAKQNEMMWWHVTFPVLNAWRRLQGLCTGSEFLLVLSVIYVRWDDTLPSFSVDLWLSLGKPLCSHVNEIYAVVFGEQPQLSLFFFKRSAPYDTIKILVVPPAVEACTRYSRFVPRWSRHIFLVSRAALSLKRNKGC